MPALRVIASDGASDGSSHADFLQSVEELAAIVYAGRTDDCIHMTPAEALRLVALARAVAPGFIAVNKAWADDADAYC